MASGSVAVGWIEGAQLLCRIAMISASLVTTSVGIQHRYHRGSSGESGSKMVSTSCDDADAKIA